MPTARYTYNEREYHVLQVRTDTKSFVVILCRLANSVATDIGENVGSLRLSRVGQLDEWQVKQLDTPALAGFTAQNSMAARMAMMLFAREFLHLKLVKPGYLISSDKELWQEWSRFQADPDITLERVDL